jgi:hypothetical protein
MKIISIYVMNLKIDYNYPITIFSKKNKNLDFVSTIKILTKQPQEIYFYFLELIIFNTINKIKIFNVFDVTSEY